MLSAIRSKIRNLIKDNVATTTDSFTYVATAIFTLTETAAAVSLVTINDVASVAYTFSSTTNKVTMTGSLTAGDVIVVTYTYYNYTDTELNGYIGAALDFMATFGYGYFEINSTAIYPIPTLKEKSLIASICYMLIEPDYSEYRLPNVTIKYPRALSKEAKIEQLIHRFKINPGQVNIVVQSQGIED